MVKVIVGLIMAAFLLTPVYAQGKKTASDVIQKMTTDLNLSVEQVKVVKSIIEGAMLKREALMKDQTKDKDVVKDELKKVRKEEGEQLAKVLTPEQLTKMDDLKKANKKKGNQADKKKGNKGKKQKK